MQVSYNWLRELVDFELDPHALATELTSIGTAVESVEPFAGELDNVVVGKIISSDPHPNKPNLKVCVVELGKDIEMTLVCGAPNVRVGMKAPVALPGAKLADGAEVQVVEKFGVKSEGMLCSPAELGLSEDASGLMEIDPSIKAGSDLKTSLDLDDYVLSFDLTPNRADCLSAIGIAREISALTHSPLKRPVAEFSETTEQASSLVTIEIEDLAGCPRYAARVVRNIKIGSSPWWMQQRLLAAGMRPINNIVDISNYVMLEYGQPLHAFDFDNFSQPKVIVRRAQAGEKFTTLDNVERVLSEDVLLITDGKTPVAIGGIMGGLFSEVTEKTITVLLESANFNSSIIRRGRKHLGLTSEAQTRFERGADPNIVPMALDRAVSLFEKYASAKVCAGIVDTYPEKIQPVKLELRPSRVNQVLNTELSTPSMIDILNNLEFKVTPGKNLTVEVPTFRPDVTREIDIVEEIARVHGYEKIPVVMRAGGDLVVSRSPEAVFLSQIAQSLIGQGYFEAVTNSIGDPKLISLLDPAAKGVEVLNPISEDLRWLRPNLLTGLFSAVYQNVSHQVRNVKLFEIGTVFSASGADIPSEIQHLALAISGGDCGENWAFHPGEFGLKDLQGVIEVIASHLTARLDITPAHVSPYDTVCSFQITLDRKRIGTCGKVSASVLKGFGIKYDVYSMEFELQPLIQSRRTQAKYAALPRFPGSERDIAVVLDEAVQSGTVVESILRAGDSTLKKVAVFDVYRGKQVPTGRKSIAYRLLFQDESKTLTDNEIDLVLNKIMDSLRREFGAELRS